MSRSDESSAAGTGCTASACTRAKPAVVMRQVTASFRTVRLLVDVGVVVVPQSDSGENGPECDHGWMNMSGFGLAHRRVGQSGTGNSVANPRPQSAPRG